MLTAQNIIDQLQMKPLPNEGGYYVETHRNPRSTAIYYLLTAGTFSAMHRLPGDGVYHFYLGDPVEMLQLNKDGTGKIVILGNRSLEGMQPQCIVTGGTWQGSRLVAGGKFALLGTTMAPAFEFADYEDGSGKDLLKKYPMFEKFIVAFTP